MTTPFGFRRILAATDFSPYGDAAIRQAVYAAKLSECRLVVAHVVADLHRAVSQTSYRSRIEFLEGNEEHFQRELRRQSDDRLKAAIRALGQPGVDITYETLLGEPHVELIHTVQRENYDLVVVGAGRHNAFERLVIGSTAKRLVRKCPSAVWVVKGEQQNAVTSILVAVDLSDVSRRALGEAIWLAERAGARLHVLHVVECADIPPELLDEKPAKGECGTLREIIDADAHRRLDAFLSDRNESVVPMERHLCWGRSWEEIVALANRLQVDLVALGSVGRSGLQGILLGNTAEQVLANSDCDVLTVKPADFISPIEPATWQLHPGPEQKHNVGGDRLEQQKKGEG
jgi:universal stress protein E